ncbi:HAMP domain-containing histidine kinase [Pseudoalteromonas sp. SMS1]|uniref:sensor histidine kinase n=1 Tax=Pseudoalteromonas sp. SMS1 TaxID=2908894 RepID=UPI001F46ACE2|nr:ATP-binding protein [Pseudoalteromonas sp. SMS1]MCF2856161.1 HAMP domain-containing histidine kinase [Pseudoalteromonas sp. SMS1]
MVEQVTDKNILLLEKKLQRALAAKALAENLLESKSRSLYKSNDELSNAIKSLKSQEAQLIQQEKMASLGQLSAGIAHELNTPAGYARSNIETLQMYLVTLLAYQKDLENMVSDQQAMLDLKSSYDVAIIQEDIPDLMDESICGLNKIASIVSELRNYTHVDNEDMELEDLNLVLDQAINLAHSSFKHHATLDTRLEPIPKILCKPNRLCQVFVNLLVNAGQAVNKGGKIIITSTSDEHYVYCKVQDNGSGISPDNMRNIFDPFFTTKPVGKGTGLGLSISYKIIEQHNGHINVESAEGVGTTFTITLPKSQEHEA